jgi:hypothetical protein
MKRKYLRLRLSRVESGDFEEPSYLSAKGQNPGCFHRLDKQWKAVSAASLSAGKTLVKEPIEQVCL